MALLLGDLGKLRKTSVTIARTGMGLQYGISHILVRRSHTLLLIYLYNHSNIYFTYLLT
jgi:hypothetical protein